MIPETLSIESKQTLTKQRLLFTKGSFLIFIQLIWLILKQYPPQGRFIALDIYRDALRLGIF